MRQQKESQTAQSLSGRSIYVVVSSAIHGVELATGLAARGARIVLLSEQAVHESQKVALTLLIDFGSRASISQAFARAEKLIGAPNLVVACIASNASTNPCSLDQFSGSEWADSCMRPLKATLHCLQVAGNAMAAQGGGIVLLGPTLGYTGARDFVALTTLAEGQRGLMKSAARQLGPLGVTVNWIALSLSELYPHLSELSFPHVPEMGPPPLPLGAALSLSQALTTVEFLGGAGDQVLTGASLNLDGGEWMLP